MTAKTHSPISVANYLLKKDKNANGKGDGTEILKLIKLVYLCHAWHLGIHNQPLVDEVAEAWPYGPIFPSIVAAGRKFLPGAIKQPLGDGQVAEFTNSQQEIVDRIYDQYGRLDGVTLMRRSHIPGTPWDKTWTKGLVWYKPWNLWRDPPEDTPIPNDLIRRYYGERELG